MSDDAYNSEGEELPPAVQQFLLASTEEPVTESLRWTPTTFLVDLLGAFASFFDGQARSLAARASLKEELKDHKLRARLRREARRQMRRDTLEDIAVLPEARE